MKCPKCFKKINNEALFCGYCGQVINKETMQEIPVEELVTDKKQPVIESKESVDNATIDEKSAKRKKKNIGLKILLIFSIVAIVTGAIIGLLSAKGIIDFSNVIPSNRFEWTDFSESVDSDDSSLIEEEEDNKTSKEDKNQSTSDIDTASSESNVHSKRILTVGVSPDYEPFEFYENNQLVGFDIDFIKLIADELNYEIEFKVYSFESLVSAVANGDIDLAISAITVTEKRRELVDFTDFYVDETYEYEGQQEEVSYAIAIQKNSSLKQVLNEQIHNMKENGKIQKLTNKYYID